MADTIVKSFVIDTSKAEQNLRSLDAATIVTKNSLDALYNQLVQLDAQLNGLDPNSEAFANVNTQIQALEATISNIETGGIQNIGTALDDIDTAKVKEVGDAIQSIDTGDAARNIENVADAVEQVVAPVNQLSSATGQLNDELKDTKVDTSNLDTAATEYKDLAVTQEEVVTSSKSLKAQLRELQAQLAATDPDSAKYRELSQAAGELKDRIQDAAQAVGTQAGGAFERVGGSLGLVTSRIANLDFTGAAEGAKQLAANIGQVKPGDIAKGISSIGSAFASVGKALLTNPIFLIGAAIAAAIVYADELLSLIDGVTDAEKEALNAQKERAALAKENFDRISATEETLKRQGLTEKQITDLKLTQLNTAIAEQQATIETTRIQAEGQIKAAERNAQYLKTFLDFVTLPQKKIAEFFQSFVNGSIEVLNKLGLGIEKIDVVSVFDDVNNFIVKKIFDPEEERKNQEKIVADATKSLETLVNTRDGILNAQAAKEKAASDKAASDAKTAAEKRAAEVKAAADAQLKAAEELAAAEEALFDELLQSFEANEKAKTEATLKEKQKQLDAATTYYNKLAALQDEEFESTLTASEKEEQAVTQKYEDLFASAEAYNATLKAGEEGNAIDIVALQKELAAKILEIQTKSADDQQSTTLQRIDNAIKWAEQGLSAFSALTDAVFANRANKVKKGSAEEEALAKKQFKVNKTLQLAGATIDASKAITASLASAPVAVLGVPNPAGIASLALAITQGVSQIAKIKSIQFQGGGTPPDTSTPPPSVGGGGESQPAQFNPLAAQFINDRPEQLTPRAFVLAGDVASQQEVREKVQDLARLG
jgi:flagellar motility protein MotE (MotC chaperone)